MSVLSQADIDNKSTSENERETWFQNGSEWFFNPFQRYMSESISGQSVELLQTHPHRSSYAYEGLIALTPNVPETQPWSLEVPVGSILAWHKDLSGVPSLLPTNYVECNGQILNMPTSPLHGQTIPDLNGSRKFLRGKGLGNTGDMESDDIKATASLGGGSHSHTGSAAAHDHTMNHGHTGSSSSHDHSINLAHTINDTGHTHTIDHGHTASSASHTHTINHGHTVTDAGHTHNINIRGSGTGTQGAEDSAGAITGSQGTSSETTGVTVNSHTGSSGGTSASVAVNSHAGNSSNAATGLTIGAHSGNTGLASPTLTVDAHSGNTGSASPSLVVDNVADHTHMVGSGSETRPTNMSVVWIMRVA
jgi:hypothetical protein